MFQRQNISRLQNAVSSSKMGYFIVSGSVLMLFQLFWKGSKRKPELSWPQNTPQMFGTKPALLFWTTLAFAKPLIWTRLGVTLDGNDRLSRSKSNWLPSQKATCLPQILASSWHLPGHRFPFRLSFHHQCKLPLSFLGEEQLGAKERGGVKENVLEVALSLAAGMHKISLTLFRV